MPADGVVGRAAADLETEGAPEGLTEWVVPSCGAGILPFAAQVVRQVARPLGATLDERAATAREIAVARALATVLRAACDLPAEARASGACVPVDEIEEPAALLAADVPLLSACFQNLDLLPPSDPAGDAVALLVMEAMERLRAG